MISDNELQSKNHDELVEMVSALQEDFAQKNDELKSANSELATKTRECEILQEKLRLALSARFSKKSEKFSADIQADLFDEAQPPEDLKEVEATDKAITIASHERKKRGRKPLPDYLPRVEKHYDLDEADKICNCGSTLTKIGETCSEQLEFIPAVVQVMRHVRHKYACKNCELTIKEAPAPKCPIPKSIATPSLLAHILVSKYTDHLPLYRQEAILNRHDIDISRGTLASWVIKCANLLTPLIKLMSDDIMTYDVAYCDETTVQVLKEKNRPPDKKSYMWVYHGGPSEQHAYIYQYEHTRGQTIPLKIFEDFAGYLHIDGYAGYNRLTEKSSVKAVGFRVDEDVTALIPHRPGRAQLTHPVLHRYCLAS